MKFGLSFLPDVSPAQISGFDYYQGAMKLCEWGDKAGFDYVKMTEHYMHPYGGYCPSPLAFLAWVAARTQKIRLMTGCVLPSFHHPVELASRVSQVDALSGGRLEVGLARGYLPHEFATFGIDLDTSLERFEDSVTALVELWSKEGVSRISKYFSYSNTTVLPRPTQKPHPPIWMAAVLSPASYERAAKMGAGLLMTPSKRDVDQKNVRIYRETFVKLHPDKTPKVAGSIPVFIAKTASEAREIGDLHLRRYLDVWASATETWGNKSSKDYKAYTGMSRTLRVLTPKDMRLGSSAIIGDPVETTGRIKALQQSLNLDALLCQVDFGGMKSSIAISSMKLFAKEVMPVFSDAIEKEEIWTNQPS